MNRPDPLALWDTTAQDVLAVLRDLRLQDWDRPALPEWSVRDVVAHLAHLESEAAGMDQPAGGDIGLEARRNQAMPTSLTQVGVDARRGMSAEGLLDELERACVGRREVLAGLDLSDPKAPAPGIVGELGWDLRTWLTNRPIDLWVHEQDVRLATGRPVTIDTVGAAHVAGVMSMAFPAALRRLSPGTSVVARVSGPQGRVLTARVGEDGRAAPFAAEEGSDVTLDLDDVTWLLLATGRLAPEDAQVRITGDQEIAATVLGRLNVTP